MKPTLQCNKKVIKWFAEWRVQIKGLPTDPFVERYLKKWESESSDLSKSNYITIIMKDEAIFKKGLKVLQNLIQKIIRIT